MKFFEAGNLIHFVGVGGIGMSGLARLSLESGIKVTGADQNDSALIERLVKDGMTFKLGHNETLLTSEHCLLVYSEAIPYDNAERLKARELGIPEMNYFEALGEFSKDFRVIAIAGTHGKTTTTAILSLILIEAGFNPTVLVGSTLKELDGLNSKLGSDIFIVEACEYRRNFLPLQPELLGILNIDYDHVDYFKNPEDYRSAFEELASDSTNVIWPENFSNYEGDFALSGDHNRQNAGLAVKIAKLLGVNDEVILKVLSDFTGAVRRFERIDVEGSSEWNGAHVYDDYAHHPVEITATLKALKEKYPNKKRIAVFQAHQHSRALQLLDDFKKSFDDADLVLIPNIYFARDSKEDVEEMSAERFATEISAAHKNVKYTESLEKTKSYLKSIVDENSVVIVMGAGDVNKIIR